MKEPVVFLPPMMCDARVFGPQLAELSADRAIMCAPIHHGERVEEIASDILAALPLKFALAGLSMGAMVAMEILRRAPERVTRLALMDTTPLPETPQAAADREPKIIGARAGRLTEVVRSEIEAGCLAPGPQRSPVMDLVLDMAAVLGSEAYVRQTRALQRRRDQQSILRKCKVPTLVLCGEHDARYPVKRHSFMADLIPYAQLRVIAGAGMMPTLEQPDATTAALREWLAQPFVLQ